jgi:hypothetical protein
MTSRSLIPVVPLSRLTITRSRVKSSRYITVPRTTISPIGVLIPNMSVQFMTARYPESPTVVASEATE